MIVFDLKCAHAHVFEVWFGSSADYESQRTRGLITCPYCGDGTIEKAVMAPRISAKGNAAGSDMTPAETLPVALPNTMPAPAEMKALLARMARMQSDMLAKSEWVGRTFADKARAMHLGETDHSPIHGEVSIDEARALQDEGVPVAALPFPVIPPEAQN